MFVANMIVDVYRQNHTTVTSEYDVEGVISTSMIYRDMPIHMTPYTPKASQTSERNGQWTRITANIRMNYTLQRDDILKSKDRSFKVEKIESTGGAFMSNSIILELSELDAII